MESITALVAGVAALAFSYYVGQHLSVSTIVASVLGAATGVGFALLYFIATVAVGGAFPGTFVAWSVGIHFIVLLALVPLVAAVIAAIAQRQAYANANAKMTF
ncbi:MAG: hypothetical protein K2Y40_22355 [Reyranella sp.]|nr:hypothetical protein [Reyranella sp.]